MKVISFGADDKKVFDTAFKSVAQDWVKDVDKRGKPGSDVFKALALGASAVLIVSAEAPRSDCIDSSATLAIVVSSTCMIVASMIDSVIRPLL